ncbi:MAG: hypothetical protein K1X85_03750 [Ignavibacteria bacterium]|nr:hypothetical protein [Ignavibacteria bacterium]
MEYKDTKLIVFLRTLTGNEMNELEKFLSSPYHIRGRDPLPLFTILRKYHPDFSKNGFSEDAVLRELVPGAGKDNKNALNTLRSLSSYLLRAVEEFLFISDVRNSNTLRNRTLLAQLLDRNMIRSYPQYLKSAYEDLREPESRKGLDNMERYYIEKLNSRYSYITMEMDDYFNHNMEYVKHLSAQFWIDLLANAKSRILGKDNHNIIMKNSFIEDIIAKTDLNSIISLYDNTANEFYLKFHYRLYLFLSSGNDTESFHIARDLFLKSRKQLSALELVYYYSELTNMYQTRFIPVNPVTKRELFELLRSCIEDRAYKISDEDFMHPLFYRNVILCADYLQECEWAYGFIDKYSSELRPELRDNLSLYSRALIDYRLGKYEESLSNIAKVKYDLVAFKSDVKTLMLRIFFELKLEDQAAAMADSARHYIKTAREFNDHSRTGYRNFLNFYMKLLKLRVSDAKSKSEDARILGKEMDAEKNLIQRKWLMEKIGEML